MRIFDVNQAYLDVTRSHRPDLLGRPLFQAFDSGPGQEAPENVRQVRASLEKARDTRQRDHLALVRYSLPRRLDDCREVFEESPKELRDTVAAHGFADLEDFAVYADDEAPS